MNNSLKYFIYFFIALFAILIIILIINRRLIFGNINEEIKHTESIRNEKALLPLKKFNKDIFEKISFTGTIIKSNYSRTKDDESNQMGGSYWLDINIDNKVFLQDENIPLKISHIYNVQGNPIQIYYRPQQNCTLDSESIGYKVEKKLGEDFIRIFPVSTDSNTCDKLYYTTDFEYFWK